jgi:hypothetical protein
VVTAPDGVGVLDARCICVTTRWATWFTLTVTSRLRWCCATRFAAWSQVLDDSCAAHGVRYVWVPKAVPPAELVVGALRRDGLVGR